MPRNRGSRSLIWISLWKARVIKFAEINPIKGEFLGSISLPLLVRGDNQLNEDLIFPLEAILGELGQEPGPIWGSKG